MTEAASRTPASAPVNLDPYGLIGTAARRLSSGYYLLYEGPIGYLDGAGCRSVKYTRGRTRKAGGVRFDRRLA